MNLVERVKAIILTPKTEWPVIEREPGDVTYLFTNYVAILAAIPAVCGLIGTVLLLPFGLIGAVVVAIVGYVLSFVAVYVLALIADVLAPNFGGRKDFASALKLAVYSYTPGWLAGVFSLVPALGFLGILGLYALYLFYLGAGPMMKVPEGKATGYTVVVVICGIVLSLILGAIPALLLLR